MATSKRKKLTQREAWEYLARKWKRAKDIWGDGHRVEIFDHHPRGLCSSINQMAESGKIDHETQRKMLGRVDRHGCKHGHQAGAYLWHRNADGAKRRVAFCLKHARSLAARVAG